MPEGGIRESDWICQRGHFQWLAGLRPRWFIRVYTTAVITSDTRFRAWIESWASVLCSGNLDQASPNLHLRDIASRGSVTQGCWSGSPYCSWIHSLRVLVFAHSAIEFSWRGKAYYYYLHCCFCIIIIIIITSFSCVSEGFIRFASLTSLLYSLIAH